MINTMSAVTNQPLPFGGLERERHIQMIFRAFKNRCGPSCECQTHKSEEKSCHAPPSWEPDEQQLDQRETETSCILLKRLKEEEEDLRDTAGLQFMSALESVSQIHITARPELQGPQCVSRRIYSISTGGSRSQLFVAVEESSCVCLQCCGPARACSLQGFDCQGQQVFRFERPLRVDACCCGCCLMEIRAYTPQKHLIGTVYQRWSMFTPFLEVCDSEGSPIIRIQGSCCPCRCFSSQQFQIISNIGEQIGTIWKRWPGFNEERNMDHELFGLEVPLGLQSHTKLLLLAATFLLRFLTFGTNTHFHHTTTKSGTRYSFPTNSGFSSTKKTVVQYKICNRSLSWAPVSLLQNGKGVKVGVSGCQYTFAEDKSFPRTFEDGHSLQKGHLGLGRQEVRHCDLGNLEVHSKDAAHRTICPKRGGPTGFNFHVKDAESLLTQLSDLEVDHIYK